MPKIVLQVHTMQWTEISVQCDGEAAEAVAELFNRFNSRPGEGASGAVIEVGGFDAYGELTEPVVTVRTYLPADDAERRRQIEEGLWFLGRLYPCLLYTSGGRGRDAGLDDRRRRAARLSRQLHGLSGG